MVLWYGDINLTHWQRCDEWGVACLTLVRDAHCLVSVVPAW